MTSTATAIRPAPAFAESVGVGAARGAARLWHSLMLARVVLGVLLAIAVLALFVWSGASKLMVAVCVGYAALAIAVRAKGVIPTSPAHFDRLWPQSVGIDVLAFASIHSAQLAGLNFAPLFIVPVLTAAMLGSNTLSMATAAGVSIFLLAEAWWFVPFGAEVAPRLLQAGLYGMGFFGLALTAQPLAQRLAQEENLARTSENLVRMQTLVNQLVIEGMSDGVLLVDGNGVVHSLNPAANRMFESPLGNQRTAPFVLAGEAAWREVAQLVATSVQMGDISEELSIQWPEVPARRILAQTR
jgi:two-component system, NtrC family, sensor histidine kinase PilS